MSDRTNTKRAIGYGLAVLVGLLVLGYITKDQFVTLWQSVLLLFPR